ncbi:hypothetical protein TTY48_29360 [Tsukamurella sp. TY48]|nr:serine/threonine-protein kinase [Tsukamurella sp. TY48]GIZ98324.1 hypothetical protein TTY48_29360 [Tsukamurella sp. TY48]
MHATSPLPSRIDEYPVVRRLGAGGMGEVFLVRHPRLPRMQALKVLRTAAAPSNPASLARFEREADILARLTHPNIVEVYDRGWWDGRPWIAMEYVAGTSVGNLLRRGPLPPDAALAVLRATAEALDYAWTQHRVVHRDVKPDNILVVGVGPRIERVTVADFGIAKAADAPANITAFGMALGTTGYAAPEVLTGHPSDDRSDQYSLAATAFTMLTGTAPFRGERAAVLDAQLTVPVPAATQRNAALPAAVDQVLGRGLNADPLQRFGSSREFVAALDRALSAAAPTVAAPVPAVTVPSGTGTRPQSPTPRAEPAPLRPEPTGAAPTFATAPRRRHRVMVVVAAAFMLAGAALVGTAHSASVRSSGASAVPAATPVATPGSSELVGDAPADASADAATMPDLRGLSFAEAAEATRTLGLTLSVVDPAAEVVTTQNPAPGAMVRSGDRVVVNE